MTDEQRDKLVEEHWKFLEPRYAQMFKDGWIHGSKHERQSMIAEGWQPPVANKEVEAKE